MFDIKCPICERNLRLPEEPMPRTCECPTCHAVFSPDGSVHCLNVTTMGPHEKVSAIDLVESWEERETFEVEVLADRERFRREMEVQTREFRASMNQWKEVRKLIGMGSLVGFGVSVWPSVLMIFFFSGNSFGIVIGNAVLYTVFGSVVSPIFFGHNVVHRLVAFGATYGTIVGMLLILQAGDLRIENVFQAEMGGLFATACIAIGFTGCLQFFQSFRDRRSRRSKNVNSFEQ